MSIVPGSEFDPPSLIIELPLEGPPRVLNGRDLTEGELRRIVDWVESHNRLRLDEWLEWHLIQRGIRQAA
jgi:hypothetical protein